MLHIAAIGSGSSGNATLIRSDSTLLLLDCGFTLKETTARMAQLGLSPADVTAVLVTHEHGDHVRGIGPLSRKFNTPVWLTHGTYHGLKDSRFPSVNIFHAHESFTIGDIELDPFPTPHDAAESCQFVFSHRGTRFACATDLGVCTPHVQEKLQGVHGVLVECNYDVEMLRNGPYPYSLQQRIQSEFGHLGNEQACALVRALDHPGLQHILLGHLSEQNNSDDCAHSTMTAALDSRHDRVTVLHQHKHSDWFAVDGQLASADVAAGALQTASAVAEPRVSEPQTRVAASGDVLD